MRFPMGILLILIGCCLMWVAMRGVETASPTGVFQALMDGMGGAGAGRVESADTNPGDASEERPNTGSEGEW